MSPSSPSSKSTSNNMASKRLSCLVPHVAAQLDKGSFVTIVHSGSSDYLRFLHDLVAHLLIHQHPVYVLDFNRRIKKVYLQQVLRHASSSPMKDLQRLKLRVVLDGDHALSEYQHLHRQTPSHRRATVLVLVDPSALFGRIIGSVKQAANTLRFQYDVAEVLASMGYAVVVADAGSRDFHRINSLVPTQLVQPAKLILQFLPRRVLIEYK